MKIKRNKKSYKWFLYGLIMVVVLTISYRVSKANYRISNSIELTTGKVVSSPYDFKLISMYIDGEEITDKTVQIPTDGYRIDEENSFCYKESKNNKDTNIKLYTDELGNHVFKGISKGSKCILYFDKKNSNAKTMNELLNTHYIIKNDRFSENKDFNGPFDKTTYGVIYSALDDDGTSYYFAGNPLDNWVLFGGYYWRIIRINGDGSIRMIYQGKESEGPQTTGDGTQIGTSIFNEKYNDNAYVGYMYGTPGSTTYEEIHKNTNSSLIKEYIEKRFEKESGLTKSKYFSKIDLDAGFCGDKQSSTSNAEINGSIGIGEVKTYYGAYVRLFSDGGRPNETSRTVQPTYNCINKDDLYTYKNSTKTNNGNKKLNNPVGLITADEMSYAGAVCSTFSANYLITNKSYWSITPSFAAYAIVFYIDTSNRLNGTSALVNQNIGVRPVINLRSDVEFNGNGTQSNPYKVVD